MTVFIYSIIGQVMRFKVYLLRYRGHRLAWRDVLNGSAHVGDLVCHEMAIGEERFSVLTLRSEDPMVASPIPALYEPVLLGFAPLAFRLRGFERIERGTSVCGVVQEWHCELP
jgi:hypothetical protein